MHSPKPPAPDPAVAAAQAAEQRRAESGQVKQTQMGLNADTVALRRRFGVMAGGVGGSAGGFTGITPASVAAAAGGSSLFDAGSFFAPGGGFAGGGGRGFGIQLQ